MDHVFDIICKKVWLIQDHKYFLLCFCLKYSILVFTFQSIIHFELTTVYCITYEPVFLYIDIQLFHHHSSKKRKSFFHWISLAISSKVNWPYMCGSISGYSILFYWSNCLLWCQYHAIFHYSYFIFLFFYHFYFTVSLEIR